MGSSGTTTLDFGAFPGKSDTSIAVTGQAAIVAGSLVEAWIRPVTTADHTDTEHMVETIKVFAADIVAGTGFTIYGFNTSQLNEPINAHVDASVLTATGVNSRSGPGQQDRTNQRQSAGGGCGTLIYGLFTVAWVWN